MRYLQSVQQQHKLKNHPLLCY